MDRKEFLKSCGYVCLGCATLTAFLQSCASTTYFANTTLDENKIIVKKTEFIETKKDKVKDRKFILIKTDKLSYPICVYKINENEFSALPLLCTHKGCELQPQGSFLICPCHGSEFTNKGIVQSPPAEINLTPFKTSIDNENIYIHL